MGPRSPKLKKKFNPLKKKLRESFRPFAPSVRKGGLSDYFDIDRPSPYMFFWQKLQKKKLPMKKKKESYFGLKKLNIPGSEIPAVTHVDFFQQRIQS
ncbi:MAG: hypothetical protein CM15mP106_3340 [Candidatus Neomarinimicrobiota bacterium]|nr:MAG: hypothetical protein CM15mP106_3340 [Candidatus Neomarinimicrobiota bacterium]